MSIARIPTDLRNRKDLTLEDIERIVHLRKQREKRKAKIEATEKEVAQMKADQTRDMAEENEILGVEDTAPATA